MDNKIALHQQPRLQKIHEAFKANDYEIRLVGGCVRDYMLGVTPKDIDLATPAKPDEIIRIGRTIPGASVIPTGLQHGTVTYHIDGENFEITTLRVDVETDGRHAQVQFVEDFKLDAARRDFTFNAMSLDFDGVVYDYFNGCDDLRNKRIRFVGDFRDRIREDFLRVLRMFRFAARFHMSHSISDDLKEFLQTTEVRKGLLSLSGERVWSELQKIFKNDAGSLQAIYAMQPLGVIEAALDVKGTVSHFVHFFTHPIGFLTQIVRTEDVERVIDRLKFSRHEQFLFRESVRIFDLTHRIMTPNMVRSIIARYAHRGTNDDDLMALFQAATGYGPNFVRGMFGSRDICGPDQIAQQAIADAKEYFGKFPVTGGHLTDLGIKPGPIFSKLLRVMEGVWFNPSRNMVAIHGRDSLLKKVVGPFIGTPMIHTLEVIEFDSVTMHNLEVLDVLERNNVTHTATYYSSENGDRVAIVLGEPSSAAFAKMYV